MSNPLKEFEAHLIADGKSLRTLESYLGDVKEFLDYISQEGVSDVASIQRQHVTAFRSQLLSRELKPATINKKVNSLACFCAWLKEKGVLQQYDNPVVPKKDRVNVASGSEGEVSVFTEEEVAKILNHVNDRQLTCLRNRLLIYLLLYTGVRVSEVVHIRIKDIDPIIRELKIVGKGGKYRTVPLRDDVLEQIQEYVKSDRQDSPFRESPYLLLSQRAPKMQRDAVNMILDRMSGKLGFKCHPHKFRHTYCSMLVKRNVPLTTVAKLAGHASVTTTAAYYVSTSKQDKLDAVNRL